MGFPYSSGDVLTAADMNAIGSWVSFVPSWVNLTIGNGTDNWYYAVVNETLFITGRTTFGSTTSITGAVQMEIPYGTTIFNAAQPVGGAEYSENGGDIYIGEVSPESTTAVRFREFNVSGSLIIRANVFATSPFTWGTDDQIRATMSLRLT